jgi:hypothetical protein
MTPYTILSSRVGTNEARELSSRLSAWHDAMVAHERRLRAGTTGDTCDDECPHAEARSLWPDAMTTFGDCAHELTFLRSRAQETRRSVRTAGATHVRAEAAEHGRHRAPETRAGARTSSGAAATAPTEV